MDNPGGTPKGIPSATNLENVLSTGDFAADLYRGKEAYHRTIEIMQLEETYRASKDRRAAHRQLYFLSMIGVLMAVATCAAIALGMSKGSDSDTLRTQSLTVTGSIVSGVLGFIAGKNID